MDNITHTLIGALIGETAALRRTPRTTQSEVRGRNLLVWIGAIGSNFPDSDLLYTAIVHEKLSYILQHRGYTHTILGATLAGILIFCCALGFAHRRKWTLSSADRWRIAALSLFAPLLHIGMDFTNNYGVHPFWPWYDGWFYGDSVFIIEPLLWAACAPLAFTLRSRVGRISIVVVLIGAIVLSIVTGMVPVTAIIVIACLSSSLLWVARAKPTSALFAGVACWLTVTFVFAFGHVQAKRVVAQVSEDQFREERLLDAVLTPLPANPFCWEALFVQANDRTLTLRRAMVAVMPPVIEAGRCPTQSLERHITAPITRVNASNSPQLKWYGQTQTALESLRELNRDNCDANGFLRFARAPWFASVEGKRVLGDLRFDREPQIGFAEMEVPNGSTCRSSGPWLPPREDVLDDSRR